MDKKLLQQIWQYFKGIYGCEIDDSVDLIQREKDLLEFLMGLGKELEQSLFTEIGSGYEGRVLMRDGKEFEFKGNRGQSIHGLFGVIEYKRAYYVSRQKGGGSYIPLDEKLGIGKKHTPGCNYFMSLFTSQGVYEKSIERFHEIFRPEGKDLISMRKVLDMDYELGMRLESVRQEEIEMAHWVGKGKNRRCQTEKGKFTRASACGGKRKAASKGKAKGRCLKWSKGRTRCLKRAK